MKNNRTHLSRVMAFAGIFFLTVLLQSSSCSKNDDNSAPGNGDFSGAWKVSLYFDNTDETHKFTGYNFTFGSGGTLTATNGSNSVTGSWSQTSTKLIIDFGTTPTFSDLNDDWLIVEKTAGSIKLKDDNPAQNDQLNFIKQ